MSQNTQFIQEFEQSMLKLSDLNNIFQKSAQDKKAFSGFIVSKLGEINSKIKGLAEKIKQLKEQVDNLQGQVNNNLTGITDKDKQIQQLQQQLQELSNQKQELTNQLQALSTKSVDETNRMQQQIDNSEATIRTLTAENEGIKSQLVALNTELTNKGDLSAEHAKQLQQLQDANTAQIAELTKQIEAKDLEIRTEVEKNQQIIEQLKQQINDITNAETTGKSQIQQLQEQLAQLQTQNDDLVQRIIAATQAINAATDNLNQLMDDTDNQKNIQDINNLFKELEASIEDISRAIQGQPIKGNNVSAKIPLDEIMNIQGVQISFGDLLHDLNAKSKQIGTPNNKYSEALNKIKSLVDSNQIPQVLMSNNIEFKNGKVFGGKTSRKTKKIRKQKGGFTYKTHSKRKKLTSVMSSTRGRGKKTKRSTRYSSSSK